jgi:hypothetical protein
MPDEGNRHEYIFLLSDTNPPKLIEPIHPGLDRPPTRTIARAEV